MSESTFRDPRLEPLDLTKTPLERLAGDDDLDPDIVAPGEPAGPLDVLRELAEPVELADVIIPNRFRPGWSVRYSTEIDAEQQLERWRKAARGKKGQVNELRFACIVLANLCLGFVREGQPVLGSDGEPLTFAHPEIRSLYQAGRAGDAVRAFYGNDPYLAATLDTVLREAGVGEEVEAVDPTEGSPV